MARQISADCVVHVQIAENPSSAVHIDDHDTRLAAVIDPYRNVEGGVLVYLPNRNRVVRQACRATYAVQVLLPTAWILQVFDGRETGCACWTVQERTSLGMHTNSPHLYSIVRDRISRKSGVRRIQRQVPTMTAPASTSVTGSTRTCCVATARSRTTRPSRVGLRKACVPPQRRQNPTTSLATSCTHVEACRIRACSTDVTDRPVADFASASPNTSSTYPRADRYIASCLSSPCRKR